MKNFNRENRLFSLCGLNCALCTMKLDGYCPGCGGGASNQGCSIARCSLEHDNCQYCFECDEYPCPKYDGIQEFDSFITHRNQLTDMKKAQQIGLDTYNQQLEQKADILRMLLKNYNDGRRKTCFCLAVNLLELEDIQFVIKQINQQITEETSLKEKAVVAAKLFDEVATQKGIVLKLHKKTK